MNPTKPNNCLEKYHVKKLSATGASCIAPHYRLWVNGSWLGQIKSWGRWVWKAIDISLKAFGEKHPELQASLESGMKLIEKMNKKQETFELFYPENKKKKII